MGKYINMDGQRYGALTVLSDAPAKNGRRMVRCRCDCGQEIEVNASNLRRGMTTSCGCSMYRAAKLRGKPSGRHEDLTGQTYGELTAIAFLHADRWLWQCSCGKTKQIRASSVKSGKVVSCGHVLSETAVRKVVEDNVPAFYDGTSVSQLRAAVSGRSKARPGNSTGHVGVRAVQRTSGVHYQARLMLRGKEISLGTYPTLDEAVAARKAGEAKYYSPVIRAYDKSSKD